MADPTPRLCRLCTQPLALHKRSDAEYCSRECKSKARDMRPISEARVASGKRWQQDNKDRVNAASARYRAKYPERRKEQNRNYKNTHMEAVRANRRKSSRTRNARIRGAQVLERFSLEEIAERDGWVCHLCGKKVNPAKKHPHNASPAIDHLVPLALGGHHTRANVALAHLLCNSRKGVRAAGEQLRLVG